MGTWLQEGIEDYDRTYPVDPKTFTVNAWRLLTGGFLKYVEELDMTNAKELTLDADGYRTFAMDSIESYCEDLIKVVHFLRKIRPPNKYYYGHHEEEEHCQEMVDAIQDDIQSEYEKAWLNQIERPEDFGKND